MATSKPATTKKKPAAKAATTKKSTTQPVTKKTIAKKAPAKKATKAKKSPQARSFHLSPDTEKFISSRITLQTVYWAVFAIVILAAGVYIINIQLDILDTLNQISEGM